MTPIGASGVQLTKDYILSFATDADGQLFLHADEKGLDLLIRRLTRLKEKVSSGDCEHEHLFTDEWQGDGDLTSKTIEGKIIHHVTVYAWTAEWVTKHGLADLRDA